MGSVERRQREREELRMRMLDAARSILVEQGYEALTMRAVAERVEYSPAALYKHFEDKDALVRAVCESDLRTFAAQLGGALGEPDPVERLKAIGRAYAAFAQEHPQQFRLLFLTPVAVHQLGDHSEQLELQAYELLAGAVRAALAAGEFAGFRAHPDLLAQTLWSSIHGVLALEWSQHHNGADSKIPMQPLRARIETMLDVMIAGLRAIEPRGV